MSFEHPQPQKPEEGQLIPQKITSTSHTLTPLSPHWASTSPERGSLDAPASPFSKIRIVRKPATDKKKSKLHYMLDENEENDIISIERAL